jgi:hypothetical protein
VLQEQLETRIHRLERRQRWLIALVVLGVVHGLVVGALGLAWWNGERVVPFELRATGFAVHRGAQPVARLEADPRGAGRLRLLDDGGRPRVSVGDQDGRGGVMDVFVPSGERTGRFGTADSGRPLVALGNADGHTVASLYTTPDGSAAFALNTQTGDPMVLLRNTDGRQPRLELYGPDAARMVFLESSSGGGALRLYGPGGNELVYAGQSSGGAGFVGTYALAGPITAAMGQVSHGLGGFLRAYGMSGEPIFSADADDAGDGVVTVSTRDGRKLLAAGADGRKQGGVINVHDLQGNMVLRAPDWR